MVLVARWTGFCLPCHSEDRLLVLTWTGYRGARAWLSGDSWTDGELRLTCTACGGVDVVGWEPEVEDDSVVDLEAEVAQDEVAPALVAASPVAGHDVDASELPPGVGTDLFDAPLDDADPSGTADGDAPTIESVSASEALALLEPSAALDDALLAEQATPFAPAGPAPVDAPVYEPASFDGPAYEPVPFEAPEEAAGTGETFVSLKGLVPEQGGPSPSSSFAARAARMLADLDGAPVPPAPVPPAVVPPSAGAPFAVEPSAVEPFAGAPFAGPPSVVAPSVVAPLPPLPLPAIPLPPPSLPVEPVEPAPFVVGPVGLAPGELAPLVVEPVALAPVELAPVELAPVETPPLPVQPLPVELPAVEPSSLQPVALQPPVLEVPVPEPVAAPPVPVPLVTPAAAPLLEDARPEPTGPPPVESQVVGDGAVGAPSSPEAAGHPRTSLVRVVHVVDAAARPDTVFGVREAGPGAPRRLQPAARPGADDETLEPIHLAY